MRSKTHIKCEDHVWQNYSCFSIISKTSVDVNPDGLAALFHPDVFILTIKEYTVNLISFRCVPLFE